MEQPIGVWTLHATDEQGALCASPPGVCPASRRVGDVSGCAAGMWDVRFRFEGRCGEERGRVELRFRADVCVLPLRQGR